MEEDTLRLDIQTEDNVEIPGENYDQKVTIKLENIDDKFTLVDVKQIMNEHYVKEESNSQDDSDEDRST